MHWFYNLRNGNKEEFGARALNCNVIERAGQERQGTHPLPSGVCCVRDMGSPRRSSRQDRIQLSLGELTSTPCHQEGLHQQEALDWALLAGAKVEEKFDLPWAGAEQWGARGPTKNPAHQSHWCQPEWPLEMNCKSHRATLSLGTERSN